MTPSTLLYLVLHYPVSPTAYADWIRILLDDTARRERVTVAMMEAVSLLEGDGSQSDESMIE